MKYIIFTLLIILLHQKGTGQNLIANPSFKDANICEELNAPCSPSCWFNVNLASGPLGWIVHRDAPPEINNYYLGLSVASQSKKTRIYWQTKLLCPLQPGITYKISLKVSAPEVGPNLNDIGFYFTDSFLYCRKDTLLQPKTYVGFFDAKYKKQSDGWFLLEKEFTAEETKGFLVVGNFSGQDNASIIRKRKRKNVYIHVCDISITAPNSILCSEYDKNKKMLYAYRKRHSINGPIKLDTFSIVSSNPEPKTELKIDTLIIPNIQFAFNSYQIKDSGIISILTPLFQKPGIEKVKIFGFTDNVGGEQYNLELSKKRADEIARLLTIRFQIPSSIIEAEGKGISTDYTQQEQNRRVEIYVYQKV